MLALNLSDFLVLLNQKPAASHFASMNCWSWSAFNLQAIPLRNENKTYLAKHLSLPTPV